MTTHSFSGEASTNGWLIAAIHFCCSEYGWTWKYVTTEISAIDILLLMRQKMFSEGHKSISLKDMEMIDSCDWDELLRKNHEKFLKRH